MNRILYTYFYKKSIVFASPAYKEIFRSRVKPGMTNKGGEIQKSAI